eukprot:gene12133-biopygen6956
MLAGAACPLRVTRDACPPPLADVTGYAGISHWRRGGSYWCPWRFHWRLGGLPARWGMLLARWGMLLAPWGMLLAPWGMLLARWGMLLARWGMLLTRWGMLLAPGARDITTPTPGLRKTRRLRERAARQSALG